MRTLRAVSAATSHLFQYTTLVRNFLGMGDNEATELTFFHEGRVSVAHATDAVEHARLLREGEARNGFNGAYMLVNGPLVPDSFARYQLNRIVPAWNGRAADAQIQQTRAVFLDVEAIRLKGISATDAEKAEALAVAHEVRATLAGAVGSDAIGIGDSGNGAFLLIAIEPIAPGADTKKRIARLLGLLNRKFGNERVKVDCSTFNPARLMPAPGTWKRKGFDIVERPHRMTSFSCSETVARVPLEEIA